MTEGILFEHPYRGNRWRLEVTRLHGRTFAQWRKWYDAGGTWKPSRTGFTFPLASLWELTAVLMEHHGLQAPDGPQNGS